MLIVVHKDNEHVLEAVRLKLKELMWQKYARLNPNFAAFLRAWRGRHIALIDDARFTVPLEKRAQIEKHVLAHTAFRFEWSNVHIRRKPLKHYDMQVVDEQQQEQEYLIQCAG